MGVFTICLIGITLYNLIHNKKAKTILVNQTALTIIVTCFINAGYFFASDVINIDQYQGAFILEFVVVLLYLFAGKNNFHIQKKYFIYALSLLASFFILLVFPSSSANVTGAGANFEHFMVGTYSWLHPSVTKFSIFFLVLGLLLCFFMSVIFERFEKNDWQKVIHIIAKFGKFLACVVLFEIFSKYILHSEIYSSILQIVFGTGTSMVSGLRERGNFIVLQGFTREASHFVFSSVFMIISLFADSKIQKRKNKNKVWIILYLIFILMSGGFSMIMAFASILIFYCIYSINSNPSKKASHGLLAVVFAFICLSIGYIFIMNNEYLYSRMNEAFELLGTVSSTNVSYWSSKAAVTSTETRFYSTFYTFMQWMKRPLFGLGEGTTECYSSMVTFAEIGLLGVVNLILVWLEPIRKMKFNKKTFMLIMLTYLILTLLVTLNVRIYLAAEPFILIGAFICLFGQDSRDVRTKI